MVKVSVLVPIYNVEKYLPQCLESLMHQTLSEIEMICVDDGATDQSALILDEYAQRDQRIKAYHKQNTGYGNTMNVALDHATGDYIAILESDDFAEPDMLESLYAKAVEKNVDVVKANLYGYRNGKDTYEDRVAGYPLNEVLRVSDYPQILSMADSIWSCIYKREFLIKNQIRFHETPGAAFQDISFAEQVWLSAETVCFLNKPILHYRRDNENSSMYDNRKIFCVFEEYGWVEERYGDSFRTDERMKKIAPFYYATKYRDFLDHYRRVGAQFQYALLLQIEEKLKKDLQNGNLEEGTMSSEIWESLVHIDQDSYAFFRRTAKHFEDIQIKGSAFLNTMIYAEGFLRVIRDEKRLAIYGAGAVGQKVHQAFTQRGCHIECFVVTEKNGQPESIEGTPIRSLQELIPDREQFLVLIAVTDRKQMEIYQNLKSAGFSRIIRVDDVIRTLFENER